MFEVASNDLLAADKERMAKAADSQTHDLSRRALIDETEALIASTQIGILTAYPGDASRVRATLATRKDSTRVKDSEDPEKKPE